MKSLSQYIIEKALERKKYLANVKDIAPVIMEHIILIHVYSDSKDVKHWKSEIYGNLSRLFAKIKSGNKEAKRSILHNYLIDEYYDNFDHQQMYTAFHIAVNKKEELSYDGNVETLVKRHLQRIRLMYSSIIEYIVADDIDGLKNYVKQY